MADSGEDVSRVHSLSIKFGKLCVNNECAFDLDFFKDLRKVFEVCILIKKIILFNLQVENLRPPNEIQRSAPREN